MSRTDILMTAPMMPIVIEALDKAFTLHRLWEQSDQEAFLKDVGPRIRGIATSTLYGRLEASLLDRLPKAEIISSFGVGYDNVDAVEAGKRGIVVTNTPGVLDDEVADLAIGLLLATLRKIPQADRYLREGKWLKAPFPLSATLREKKVGIVGLGRIGKAIARRLAGFDVRIAYHGRTQQDDVAFTYHPTIVGLAEASDILIVITPGGASTKHLINAEVLKALGSERCADQRRPRQRRGRAGPDPGAQVRDDPVGRSRRLRRRAARSAGIDRPGARGAPAPHRIGLGPYPQCDGQARGRQLDLVVRRQRTADARCGDALYGAGGVSHACIRVITGLVPVISMP